MADDGGGNRREGEREKWEERDGVGSQLAWLPCVRVSLARLLASSVLLAI